MTANTHAGLSRDYALFLDFDGTLVDIAPRPQDVVVAAHLPETLDRLRQRLGGALAIVTGRAIETIDRFLAPKIFDAGGLHGAEHRLRGVLHPCLPEAHPRLRAALEVAKKALEGVEGVLIEDKGCSFVLHWRLAPEQGPRVAALGENLVQELGEEYRLQFGKAVAEIMPAYAGKGPIITFLMRHEPFASRVPIFVGDDLTDESGFDAVAALGGIAVKVGEGPTSARFRVRSPAELKVWLREAADGQLDPVGLPAA